MTNEAGRVTLKALATHSTKRQASSKWAHTALNNRPLTTSVHTTRNNPNLQQIQHKICKHKHTITLVQLKFFHDNYHIRQLNEARTESTWPSDNYLSQTLKYDVNICPILVGTAATISTDQSSLRESLRILWLPRPTATNSCRDRHLIATTCTKS